MIFASTAGIASMRTVGVCWHSVKPSWGHCKSFLIVCSFERTHSATWQGFIIRHLNDASRTLIECIYLPSASRGTYWVFQTLAANRFVIHLLGCKKYANICIMNVLWALHAEINSTAWSWIDWNSSSKHSRNSELESLRQIVNNFLKQIRHDKNKYPRNNNSIERNIDITITRSSRRNFSSEDKMKAHDPRHRYIKEAIKVRITLRLHKTTFEITARIFLPYLTKLPSCAHRAPLFIEQ